MGETEAGASHGSHTQTDCSEASAAERTKIDMIIIEPIGQTENRYPRTEPAPIVVPKTPEISPEWKQYQPPEKKSSFWLLVLLGGIYAAVKYSGSPAPLGEALPKKRRGKKLYYMWTPAGKSWHQSVSIPKKNLQLYQMQAEKKRGKLFYIWSESADRARYELDQSREARKGMYNPESGATRAEMPESQAEQLPLFSGRKKRHPADVEAAIEEALKKVEDVPLYVYATYYGFIVSRIPPPHSQGTYIINPDQTLILREWAGRGEMKERPIEYTYEEMRRAKKRKSLEKEPEQLKLFSGGSPLGAAAILKPKPLTKQPASRLKKMELRLHVPTDTYFYVDWSKPEKSTEWYGKRYGQRRTVTLFPLYRESGEPLHYQKKAEIHKMSAEPETPQKQLPLFSGRYSNCGLWQEVPSYRSKRGFAWRCLQYGPACDQQQPDGEMCVTDPPLEKLKQRVKCKNYQLVSSAHYGKPVKRCKSYEAICTTRACLTERTPVPELEPEPEEPTESEVRAVAEWMAETEWEKRSAVDAKSLAREILSRGGIRAYRKQYPGQKTDEEYMEIPLFLKKKTGLPPDEMADEMGYDTDSDLYADIHAAYPAKTPQTALQKKMARRKPRWEDFRDRAFILLMEEKHGSMGFGQAEGVRDVTRRTFEKWITTGKAKRQYDHGLRTVYLIDGKLYQVDFGQHYSRIAPLSGVGQEQEELWKLKRELVLEPEDIATLDDPLEICLQRKGWDLRRVSKLQESISEKMTPDMFTGKTTPLSPSEKELQRYIDECYKRMAEARETGKAKQMTLFGQAEKYIPGEWIQVDYPERMVQYPGFQKKRPVESKRWKVRGQRGYTLYIENEYGTRSHINLKKFEFPIMRLGEEQQEIIFPKQAPEEGSPIPPELEFLAITARKYLPEQSAPEFIVPRLQERYRRIHPTLALPESVKGKYPKPLENILAYHYGYAGGDPERAIQAFWYHVHGYAPDSGRVPEEILYPRLSGAGCRDKDGRFVPVAQCTGRRKISQEPQGKEPWQMTKAEFWHEAETNWYKGKRFINKDIQLTNIRRAVITDALFAGYSVPRKVLADYPEILKKWGSTPAAKGKKLLRQPAVPLWAFNQNAEQLSTMEFRIGKGGFNAYIDWSNPQTIIQDGEEVEAYPAYRKDGYPIRLVSRKDIEKGSRAEERPGFGGAGCRDRDGKFVPVPQCVGKVKITEIPVITNPAVGPVGLASLEGAPAYVWKSTLKRRR